ncbi:hypothetical protein V6N11_012417 [Hibiscus sabdariffa]|uniref:RNase H type-1 domain-containing protein n=1 Tax=Hibiscus sabdariffa TaxID=183260 RepID=A0ABR2QB29_9ROSI
MDLAVACGFYVETQYALAFTSASRHLEQSRIVIEMDCMDAIRHLQDRCLQLGVPTILLHVHKLASRDWIVQYHHIPRAKN